MLDEATLRLLSRSEIQKLARANNIKANLKTVVIIGQLVERSKDQKIFASAIVPKREQEEPPRLSDREDPPVVVAESASNAVNREPPRQARATHVDQDVGTSVSATFDAVRRRAGELVPGSRSVRDPETEFREHATRSNTVNRGGSVQAQVLSEHEHSELRAAVALSRTPEGLDEIRGVPRLSLGDLPLPIESISTYRRDRTPPLAGQGLDQHHAHGLERQNDVQVEAAQSPLPPSSPLLGISSEDKLPSQSLTDQIPTSPLPMKRKLASSPLPPSSPPRDSSPQPGDELKDDNGQPQQAVSSPFWDQLEYDSNGDPISYDMVAGEDEETSLFLSPNARALRNAKRSVAPENQEAPAIGYPMLEDAGETEEGGSVDEALPIPGSGSTAYTGSDCYTSSAEGSTYCPQPADDRLLNRVVNSMASLSALYRSHLDTCGALVDQVHDTKKDAIITRRVVAQEISMSLRMAQWLAFSSNAAKKWHETAIWKYPIKLELVGDKYVEVSSDDEDEPPHGRTELKRCWIDDGRHYAPPDDVQQNNARRHTQEIQHRSPYSPPSNGQDLNGPDSDPADSPASPHSSSDSLWAFIRSKRSRSDEDSDDEPDYRIRKLARHTGPQAITPLAHTLGALEIASSPVRQVNEPMSLVVEEEEENQLDEESVNTILSGQIAPSSPVGDVEEDNPFWNEGESSVGSHEQVEVEDETGEKHRRYSFEAKGKGRAL